MQKIMKLKDDAGWLAEASIPLEELEEILDINFEDFDVVSLGGFVIAKLQHLPKKGESFDYKGFVFTVQKSSDRRVLQVLIKKH